MEKNDLFIKAIREYLGLKEDDYYWHESESALDHIDNYDCISDLCRWFYNRGANDSLGGKNV